MDAISLKLDTALLRTIDRSLKNNNYSTRTEFLRDAIRSKLDELNRRALAEDFVKSFYGKASAKTSLKEDRKIREEVSKELFAELEKRFS